MAKSLGLDDDLLWAPETRKLSEIVDEVPTLVRVTEGIYSCNDAGTFSQGDVIKIDACKSMTRVSAYLTQPGSKTRYQQYGAEISLPYNYNGRVQVLPMHGEYHKYNSVEELIKYFPRYVRVLDRINFREPSGKSQTLQPQDTLQLKAVRRDKKTNAINSVRCTLNEEDVILPKSLAGVFQVLPDDTQQTIKDVVETYKLPQCIRFIGSGLQQIMSKDIQEAIDNLQTYSGEMILSGKCESAPVLLGHYKGMEGADVSKRFVRRSAIVIPLDIPDIREIEVQLPTYMDADDYELFLLKNFSERSTTPEVLDGALYVEFARTSRVQFLSDAAAPAIPPRPKTSGPAPPQPPRPPRSAKVPLAQPTPNFEKRVPPYVQVVVSAQTTVNYEDRGSNARHLVLPVPHPTRQHTHSPQPPPAQKPLIPEDEFEDTVGFTLSSVFSDVSTAAEEDIYEPTEEPSSGLELPTATEKPKLFKKVKGLVKRVSDLAMRPEKKLTGSVSTAPLEGQLDEEEEEWYQTIDEKITQYAQKAQKAGKPTAKVPPNTCRVTTSVQDSKRLDDYSVSEMETVLIQCAMPDFAKVCKHECVDGNLFLSLTVEVLKKKPFGLSVFCLKKVEQIKDGWRPKT